MKANQALHEALDKLYAEMNKSICLNMSLQGRIFPPGHEVVWFSIRLDLARALDDLPQHPADEEYPVE